MELKIKLKVKNTEIELTQDEAVELKDLLGKLCTKETECVPWYPYWPTYRWWGDPIGETGGRPMPYPWSEITQITCDNTDGAISGTVKPTRETWDKEWITKKISDAVELGYANS